MGRKLGRSTTTKITGGPQGVDAYVLVRKPTHSEREPIMERLQHILDKAEEYKANNGRIDLKEAATFDYELVRLLLENGFITEWNWVADAEGEKPLPPPNEVDIDDLLVDEIRWLASEPLGVVQGVDLVKK